MRAFPDFLFQADPKSIAGSLIEYRRIFSGFVTDAGLAAFDFVTPPVPADRIFLVTHGSVWCATAGVQFPVRCESWETDPNGVSTGAWFNARFLGTRTPEGFDWDGEFIVRPKMRLTVRTSFTGAAANNFFTATISGWLLPRGNINL